MRIRQQWEKKGRGVIAGWSEWENSLTLYPLWQGHCQSAESCHGKGSCKDGAGEKTAGTENKPEAAPEILQTQQRSILFLSSSFLPSHLLKFFKRASMNPVSINALIHYWKILWSLIFSFCEESLCHQDQPFLPLQAESRTESVYFSCLWWSRFLCFFCGFCLRWNSDSSQKEEIRDHKIS